MSNWRHAAQSPHYIQARRLTECKPTIRGISRAKERYAPRRNVDSKHSLQTVVRLARSIIMTSVGVIHDLL